MTSDVFIIVVLIAGLIVGAIIGWFVARMQFSSPLQFLKTEQQRLQQLVNDGQLIAQDRDSLRLQQSTLQAEITQKKENLEELRDRLILIEERYQTQNLIR